MVFLLPTRDFTRNIILFNQNANALDSFRGHLLYYFFRKNHFFYKKKITFQNIVYVCYSFLK
jgi:hypothetical protein